MLKLRIFCLSLCGLIVSGCPAFADEIQTLLEKVQASSRIPFRGELHIREHEQNIKMRLIVEHNRNNAVRYRYLAPASMKGVEVIDNRELYWHYTPRLQQVEVRPSERTEILPNLKLISQNYHVRLSAGSMIAGRETLQLQIRPKKWISPGRNLLVDTETGVPLRVEIVDEKGNLIRTTEFKQIDYNAIPSDASFQPVLNPRVRINSRTWLVARSNNVEELAQIANLPTPQAAGLPPGYALQEAKVFKSGSFQTLHVSYTDGLNIISLFLDPGRQLVPEEMEGINLSLPQGPAVLINQTMNRLLAWQNEGIQMTLMGCLAASDLISIAGKTRLQSRRKSKPLPTPSLP